MAHITAGDITPIGHIDEGTFGTTPIGAFTYYGDIREGGNITPTDNPNPYINWRYRFSGSRTFDNTDYVNQNAEAGFNTAIEVRDTAGWTDILKYAGLSASATPLAALDSRTVQFGYKQDANNTQYALTYRGCKTDQLRISADVPGGVVKFDETVFAALRDSTETTFVTTPTTGSGTNAVQWVGAVTLGGVTFYPQSFSITIRNNLGRANTYDTGLGTNKAVALVEGRQEIEAEFTVWMEDFTELVRGMDNPLGARVITLTLGSTSSATLTGNAVMMADGTNQGLVQDKQLQTIRLRLSSLYYTAS